MCGLCGSETSFLTFGSALQSQPPLLPANPESENMEIEMNERENPTSLGEALPAEMTRVRAIIPAYQAVPTGFIAVALMNASMDAAQRAMAEGDVIAMLRSYEDLKGYSL